MKTDIHPDYHEINVTMTDGSTFKTRSTWGKPGETLNLDVDSKSHPAWVGGVQLRKTGRVEKFANRFGDIGALTGSSSSKKEDDHKDA